MVKNDENLNVCKLKKFLNLKMLLEHRKTKDMWIHVNKGWIAYFTNHVVGKTFPLTNKRVFSGFAFKPRWYDSRRILLLYFTEVIQCKLKKNECLASLCLWNVPQKSTCRWSSVFPLSSDQFLSTYRKTPME